MIIDHEDGVPRCADCLYEIWDGVCAGCQRIFEDNRLGASDDDAIAESQSHSDNTLSPEPEEQELEDSSYESSFIDDSEGDGNDSEPSQVYAPDDDDTAQTGEWLEGGLDGKGLPGSDQDPKFAIGAQKRRLRRIVSSDSDSEQ